jgi:hypothetical protein
MPGAPSITKTFVVVFFYLSTSFNVPFFLVDQPHQPHIRHFFRAEQQEDKVRMMNLELLRIPEVKTMHASAAS